MPARRRFRSAVHAVRLSTAAMRSSAGADPRAPPPPEGAALSRQGSGGGLYGGTADSATATHVNIWCDGCGAFPLVGARFKCLHCPDIDLCSGCMFANQHHSDHFFARLTVRNPALEGTIEPLGAFHSNEGAAAAAASGFGVVHQGVSCDACGASPLVGTRYKAMGRPNWDLCERCLSGEAVVAIRTPLIEPAFEFPPWLVRAAFAAATLETSKPTASMQTPGAGASSGASAEKLSCSSSPVKRQRVDDTCSQAALPAALPAAALDRESGATMPTPSPQKTKRRKGCIPNDSRENV